MTGVVLRVWHGLLARRQKTVVLITDDCRRASQPCGTHRATSRATASRSPDSPPHGPMAQAMSARTAHCWESWKARCAWQVGAIPSSATRAGRRIAGPRPPTSGPMASRSRRGFAVVAAACGMIECPSDRAVPVVQTFLSISR
jgi:hypothetical protein